MNELRHHRYAAAVGAVVLVLLFVIGQVSVGEPGLRTIDSPPVYATQAPVTLPAAVATVSAPPPTEPNDVLAVVVPVVTAAPLARRDTVPVTDAPPSPPPAPPGGDCTAWGHVFRWAGATASETSFFVPRIIDRETGCGRDTLNDATGDTGVCQINPIHNRAGYFGGRYFGDGGWLFALHGLTTRTDTSSVAWAAACLTLYRVCGAGAWQPPYSCANNPLPKAGTP